jgi:ABC-type uncharacterized transport system substrate-binding protein
MKRREFITLLGGAAAAWPLTARAQQPAMPVVGFVSGQSTEDSARFGAAFRKALNETGYVEGQNVTVEYHWLGGQYDRVSALMADLVQRQVAVIVTPASTAATLAAKAATMTIPIVFLSAVDPVKAGLVASLNRPGGNITGISDIGVQLAAKRLGLLHELHPAAALFGLLVNPSNPGITEPFVTEVRTAASVIGRQIEVVATRTENDIDEAFATLVNKRVDALLVSTDALFVTRKIQLVTLAARHAVPAMYFRREFAEAGGLMSYGSNLADQFRQVGVYTGRVLKGEKPAEMPVVQPTKFELIINLPTARAIGIVVPPSLLAQADEVIE